jgi:hypothetical protein
VVPACQAGDPLELTCTTNGITFIRWNFTARNSLGKLREYGPAFINSEDESQQISVIRVNATTFTIMRTSARGSSPLVSTMVINPVNRDLNGTVVNCEDIGTSMTATTTLHYVDKSMHDILLFNFFKVVANIILLVECPYSRNRAQCVHGL